jgi:outer membrane protein assembly factor BamE
MKSHILIPTIGLAALLAAACAPYKMEVQQGARFSEEALAQIKPGLTKREVRYLLGTPPVLDPFRPDRWDYYYYRKQGRFSRETKQTLSFWFEGDRVARIEGLEEAQALATSLSASSAPDSSRRPTAADKVEKTPEISRKQGLPEHREPGITDPGLGR